MKKKFFLHKFLGGAIILLLLCTAAEMNSSTKPDAANRTVSSGSAIGITNSSHDSSASDSSAAGSTVPESSSISSSKAPSSSPVTNTAFVTTAASLTATVSPPFQHPSKMVVGYYGGWAAYSGFTPDKISASSIDVLNYAFAKIGTNLQITAGDSYIDYSNFNKLRNLKRAYPGLRTVISVGGWSDSGGFSDAALTESSRVLFADSVVRFIKANGFDGVDIDWEYPTGGGLASNVTRSADRTNFPLLLKTLRSKLDVQGAKDKKHYILSFAGGSSSHYASKIGLSAISKYVDYGMIMTYDLHGSWDSFTDFNAPLYSPAGQSPQDKNSVDAAVRSWLNNGFPSKKLIMGVPFYGYAYQGASNANNGLWQRFTSASPVGYDTIQSKYLSSTSYRKFNDSSASVPWLFNGSTFISYDDAASIQKKVQYSVSKNLLGVGVWDLSFDRTGTLIKSVKTALK
nr:glycoside hydrolase family 18 protein [uncultured Caproiciproducens sp.]